MHVEQAGGQAGRQLCIYLSVSSSSSPDRGKQETNAVGKKGGEGEEEKGEGKCSMLTFYHF